MAGAEPPSKREQLLTLFESGSVFVHVDPRREGVAVPPWLMRQPQLVLQLGLNFPIPIRDLEIDDDGIRCTLSFNRAPHYCVLPWSAVYALVGEDNQVTVWPSELPAELVPTLHDEPAPAVRREGPRERRNGSGAAAALATPPGSTPSRPRIAAVSDAVDGKKSAPVTPRPATRPAPALVPAPSTPPPARGGKPNHLRLVK